MQPIYFGYCHIKPLHNQGAGNDGCVPLQPINIILYQYFSRLIFEAVFLRSELLSRSLPRLHYPWTTILTSAMNFHDWPLRCEATFLGDVFNAAIKIRINVFFHISTIITNDKNWRRVVIGITTCGPSV